MNTTTITLSRSESDLWEDSGPRGDQFRSAIRKKAAARSRAVGESEADERASCGSPTFPAVEVRSFDGTIMEVVRYFDE